MTTALESGDWENLAADHELAANAVAQYLRRGEVALFLGAGVSKSLNLLDWATLARACIRYRSGIESKGINHNSKGNELGKQMEYFRTSFANDQEYHAEIKRWLYWRCRFDEDVWSSKLLVSLGALMIGSIRGRVDTVLTPNFDSIIEMYLRMYGFGCQSVDRFPEVERTTDVRIWHSHGYLPLEREDGSDSDDIVLDQFSYDRILGDSSDPRRKMIEGIIGRKVLLAIGISNEDPLSRSLMTAFSNTGVGRRRIGFIVLRKGLEEDRDELRGINARGLWPILVKDHDEIPLLLLRISRAALAGAVGSCSGIHPLDLGV